MPTHDTQKLLTSDDVARMLRVKRRTVYDLIRRHGLPALRVGERAYRLRLAAAQRWVQEQESAEVASWSLPAPPTFARSH